MATRNDPLLSFHFGLTLTSSTVNIANSMFTEVSGLGSEHEVAEYKTISGQGTDHIGYVQKIPGRLKWEPIVLKRGITAQTMDIWKWRKQVEDGQVEAARSDGTIIMYDDTGAIAAAWNFIRGWPAKVTGPSIKSDANEVGVEELTIHHEGITRAQ